MAPCSIPGKQQDKAKSKEAVEDIGGVDITAPCSHTLILA